ncbi:conserved hypothetical protein [Desulfatibacillum aliphaticivorans]|uniref:HNH endonuclease 5 domain-containing protein n=1 Tax=Desulfatibacillum aliphaticivorans TaxID=218208 RepID=B8FFV7_DESAL|nr:HNH endonuclease [Desulfatibacillum aliphaticivorans]ACL03512.1 conserved hypothetical protein [Desulfatibacillum aliphaticivorans]
MTELSLCLSSLNVELTILIRFSGKKCPAMVANFLMIFAPRTSQIDSKNQQTIHIPQIHRNTNEFRSNVKVFIDKYGNQFPQSHKLSEFIKSLSADECFNLIVNPKDFSIKEKFCFTAGLLARNEGAVYDELIADFDEKYGDVLDAYRLITIPVLGKFRIGEPKKNIRVCRFCGKSMGDGATFTKVAHAISESLGNQKLFLNEECDDCNDYFSRSVERDIALYFRPSFSLLGFRGKEKRNIKAVGSNFRLSNLDGRNIRIEINGDCPVPAGQPLPLDLELCFHGNERIILQNIYKALVKYALSVIDSADLKEFGSTITWLRNDTFKNKLPKVATLSFDRVIEEHPKIALWVRKNERNDLPYAVCEFRSAFYIFVFIVPTFAANSPSFLDESEFENYWEFFPFWSNCDQWSFIDLSTSEPKKLIFNIQLERGE